MTGQTQNGCRSSNIHDSNFDRVQGRRAVKVHRKTTGGGRGRRRTCEVRWSTQTNEEAGQQVRGEREAYQVLGRPSLSCQPRRQPQVWRIIGVSRTLGPYMSKPLLQCSLCRPSRRLLHPGQVPGHPTRAQAGRDGVVAVTISLRFQASQPSGCAPVHDEPTLPG